MKSCQAIKKADPDCTTEEPYNGNQVRRKLYRACLAVIESREHIKEFWKVETLVTYALGNREQRKLVL